uniref:C2H2-type domain-containing protein n=1 Tax=Labrus bergylta TaxID=56723 RepID=A0A3Q3GV95_9LABR
MNALRHARAAYYSSLIEENKGNPRYLFSTVARLTGSHGSIEPCIPLALSSNDLLRFFNNKILDIRDKIGNLLPLPGADTSDTAETAPGPDISLNCFSPIDLPELYSIFYVSKPSTCLLDPIPTKLFKEVFPLVSNSILDMINSSLLAGYVPQAFKVAVIKPPLKKPTLDSETLRLMFVPADNANSLLPQSIRSSHPVSYKTQNSEDLSANTAGVQESGSTGGFKLNLASTLKDIADLTCPVCYKTFHRPKVARRHLKVAHPSQVFRCDKCDMTFQTKSRLDTHLDAHSNEKPYVCSQCGKRLSCPKVLKTHMRLHTGERPYACKFCDKKFDQKYGLTQHIRLHKGERLYLCSHCGKTFTFKGALRVHTRLHTGERPYRCKECGEGYITFQKLKNHQTIHTGERPHSCPQCGKSFRHDSGLRRHLLIHTGEKPYKCVICDKRFNLASNLRKHVKSHKTTKNVNAPTE